MKSARLLLRKGVCTYIWIREWFSCLGIHRTSNQIRKPGSCDLVLEGPRKLWSFTSEPCNSKPFFGSSVIWDTLYSSGTYAKQYSRPCLLLRLSGAFHEEVDLGDGERGRQPERKRQLGSEWLGPVGKDSPVSRKSYLPRKERTRRKRNNPGYALWEWFRGSGLQAE